MRAPWFSSTEVIVPRSSVPMAWRKPKSDASRRAPCVSLSAFCSSKRKNTRSPMISSSRIEARAFSSMALRMATKPASCTSRIRTMNSATMRFSRRCQRTLNVSPLFSTVLNCCLLYRHCLDSQLHRRGHICALVVKRLFHCCFVRPHLEVPGFQGIFTVGQPFQLGMAGHVGFSKIRRVHHLQIRHHLIVDIAPQNNCTNFIENDGTCRHTGI